MSDLILKKTEERRGPYFAADGAGRDDSRHLGVISLGIALCIPSISISHMTDSSPYNLTENQ